MSRRLLDLCLLARGATVTASTCATWRLARQAVVMVFWITNRYRDKATGWSLERLGPALTEGVADRVLGGT